MIRFTIRETLLIVLVVALALMWCKERAALAKERAAYAKVREDARTLSYLGQPSPGCLYTVMDWTETANRYKTTD
jgi:hypothetical protein